MLVLSSYINDARIHKEAVTLASSGNNVLIVALWKPGLEKTEKHHGYRVIRLRLLFRKWNNRLLSPPIKYLEYAIQVWLLAGHEPAQLYHANDANTLIAAWLASKRNHAKLVYDAHELETGRNFSGSSIADIYRTTWALPEKIFIHKVQTVITVSPFIADELVRLYQIPTPKVIYNCPEKFSMSYSDRIYRELNISTDQNILLYQGNVTYGRGIEAFFNAVQLVENSAGVILGDGPALEMFRNRVKAGEWKRIFLPGKVPLNDLPSYTVSSTIGIVLTQDTCLNHRLTLPNKLFEYIHAGLPVVCSNLPALAQFVNEYQIGVLVNPEDPISIATGIESIINDNNFHKQLKLNARKITDIYNWQNESQKLLEIYQSLLS
jgi:glycosyltransferase involved in cell wall biosynthesis